MPTYSYSCDECKKDFELFFYIKDYIPKPQCIFCNSNKTNRSYIKDVATQNLSVKKSDSELRTIGDLANRNRDKMSDDQKLALHNKHNEYKYEEPQTKLPSGMKRIKKPKKTKWT
jgi:putative FmdB family regulatory protein